MTFPPGPLSPRLRSSDGVNVDAVAAAVLGCAGVAGLDGGRFGEVASYLPGRKVPGVVVSGGRVTVQIRSRWAVPMPDLAALVTVAAGTAHREPPGGRGDRRYRRSSRTPEHPTAAGGLIWPQVR